jgi:hypothetical protein
MSAYKKMQLIEITAMTIIAFTLTLEPIPLFYQLEIWKRKIFIH